MLNRAPEGKLVAKLDSAGGDPAGLRRVEEFQRVRAELAPRGQLGS